MDLIKIGKFIAELRKEQGLSQTQLGEKNRCDKQNCIALGNGNVFTACRYAVIVE